jgi:hypothetical protein
MISDVNAGHNNAIPGRLKAIVISDHLSIAYAGHSDPALHAVRRIPDIYVRCGFAAVLQALSEFPLLAIMTSISSLRPTVPPPNCAAYGTGKSPNHWTKPA